MSAIPHASGLPTPNPARSSSTSGPKHAKGAFPPTPKSVRVWAVLEHGPAQHEPASPAGQLGSTHEPGPARALGNSSPWFWGLVTVGVLVCAGILGAFLANHMAR